MNLLDDAGLVHLPPDGLATENEAFQLFIDSGFIVNADVRCKPNLQVVQMVDSALSCVACIALAEERTCSICAHAHFGPCQL